MTHKSRQGAQVRAPGLPTSRLRCWAAAKQVQQLAPLLLPLTRVRQPLSVVQLQVKALMMAQPQSCCC